jgi:hypothetical protein
MAHKWLKWLITNQVTPANWKSEDLGWSPSRKFPPKSTNLVHQKGASNRLINASKDSPTNHMKGATKGPMGTFMGHMGRGEFDEN